MNSSISLPEISDSRRRGSCRPEREVPPFSISILEDEKFTIKLQNMMGAMAKFNGVLVNPRAIQCQVLANGIVKEMRSTLQAY